MQIQFLTGFNWFCGNCSSDLRRKHACGVDGREFCPGGSTAIGNFIKMMKWGRKAYSLVAGHLEEKCRKNGCLGHFDGRVVTIDRTLI